MTIALWRGCVMGTEVVVGNAIHVPMLLHFDAESALCHGNQLMGTAMTLTAMLASSLSTPLVNGLIALGFGIYSTLVGFGFIPANFTDAKKSSAWLARWGTQARIGGPLLILIGTFLTVRAL